MRLNKCYRYRLSPTPEQETAFLQWAGCRRFVWNWALLRRRQHYGEMGKSLSFASLCLELTALKKVLPWLGEADSQCLQQVLRDLDTAYTNFFQKRAGFPKRKKKFQCPNAFRIPQRVGVKSSGCILPNGKQDAQLSLPKIGLVPMIQHRPLDGTVKSATVKQEASGHWFVTFVTEHEVSELPKTCNAPVGIDIGLESFLATSDGDKVDAPRFFRKQQAKIKRASRRFSRKQKGSQNKHKARRRLACVHASASRKRNDFLHKLSTALVEKHDVLCLEDITIAHAAKTKLRGHSKSWYDAAHGAFRRMLQYKAEWQNKSIVLTDKWFPSSQLCSKCGFREKHDLSIRQWTCQCCSPRYSTGFPEGGGTTRGHSCHDRDVNAAINIRNEGLRLLNSVA